jgi:cbb3-type cytochrome oxidase subunit 3
MSNNLRFLTLSVAFFSVILFSFGCGKRSQNEESARVMAADSTMAPSPVAPPVSSSAATVNTKDTVRKFIRTADLKFKVPDVVKTTYKIEDITSSFGGFVEETSLASNIQNRTETQVSEDSTLETTYYIVTNSMTLRVPDVKLDTALKSIAPLIEYLDSRVVTAQDVRFDIYANQLAIARSGKQEHRVTTTMDHRGKNIGEVSTGEDHPLEAQERADDARVDNLRLQDQIAYSTIHLNIYQRQALKRELIANDKNITAYEPSLGHRIGEALQFGWKTLESIVVSLVKIWGILAFILVLFIVYKLYSNRTKNNNE